jgi:hypothetical protein
MKKTSTNAAAAMRKNFGEWGALREADSSVIHPSGAKPSSSGIPAPLGMTGVRNTMALRRLVDTARQIPPHVGKNTGVRDDVFFVVSLWHG